jgi:hypothetical protein
MEPALSRGDTPLKINSWPQAVVAGVGILAVAGIVIALALAGWSAEAIIGFGGLALALVTGQYVQTRRAAVVEAKTDQQTNTLEVIADQTNGRLRATVADAVEHGIQRAVTAYRAEQAAGGELPTRMPDDPFPGAQRFQDGR